ncbi:unnamed protein product [Paramecium primaurelia]|uniref:Uncharacterized protein n=1 Tax=Paramecium primaurelia TaxID=5886 RepID=A0A8S1LP40_PARPR|nr:unnamed protein product [Paramecium primaurelia]
MNSENYNQNNSEPILQNFSSSNFYIEPTNFNQQLYWFQSKEATEILIILASQCQIIFKCVSGRRSKRYQSDIQEQFDVFKDFKNQRKIFLYKIRVQYLLSQIIQNCQNDLLRKLEKHLQINLIGDQKEMNFFFFGRNNVTIQTQHPIMDILNPYIHQDFIGTLTELLELRYQVNNTNHYQSRKKNLYNINNHKHLVCWAFISAWQIEIREHLKQLQEKLPTDNQVFLTQGQKSQELIQLKSKSDEIWRKEKQEVEQLEDQDINQLIMKYQQQSNEKIHDIIKMFEQRSLYNNY